VEKPLRAEKAIRSETALASPIARRERACPFVGRRWRSRLRARAHLRDSCRRRGARQSETRGHAPARDRERPAPARFARAG
jgi:hypothetical protein